MRNALLAASGSFSFINCRPFESSLDWQPKKPYLLEAKAKAAAKSGARGGSIPEVSVPKNTVDTSWIFLVHFQTLGSLHIKAESTWLQRGNGVHHIQLCLIVDPRPTCNRMSAGQREGRRKRRRPSNPTLQILQWLPKIIHSHELEGSDTVTEDDQNYQNCGFVVPPFLNHKKLDRTCRSPSMLFSSLGSPAKLVQFQSPKRLGHQKRQEVVLSSTNDLENIRPTKAIALPALPVAHPRGQHF